MRHPLTLHWSGPTVPVQSGCSKERPLFMYGNGWPPHVRFTPPTYPPPVRPPDHRPRRNPHPPPHRPTRPGGGPRNLHPPRRHRLQAPARLRPQQGPLRRPALEDRLRPHGGEQVRRPQPHPKPRAIVECGSYSNPNLGCTDEREDAIAAYTQALMWYVTRDARHAAKAIQLMDAWSAVIRDHTNSNAPLQTGWAAPPGPRPPRSSSTPGPAAGPTRTASPPRCATSTCPRSSTARTPTGTGS